MNAVISLAGQTLTISSARVSLAGQTLTRGESLARVRVWPARLITAFTHLPSYTYVACRYIQVYTAALHCFVGGCVLTAEYIIIIDTWCLY